MTITKDDLAQITTDRHEKQALGTLSRTTQYVFMVTAGNVAHVIAAECSQQERRTHLLELGVDMDDPHTPVRYAYGHLDNDDRVVLAGNCERTKEALRRSFWAIIQATTL